MIVVYGNMHELHRAVVGGLMRFNTEVLHGVGMNLSIYRCKE